MKQLFTFLYVIIRLINDIDQTIEKGAQEIQDHSTSPEGPHNHLQNIPFMDKYIVGNSFNFGTIDGNAGDVGTACILFYRSVETVSCCR